jgi:hypothetical protein
VIVKAGISRGTLSPRGLHWDLTHGTNWAVLLSPARDGGAVIEKGQAATHWTRLSCPRFQANEVRALLGVIAYNLDKLGRRLILSLAIQGWSLTRLQQRLLNIGGRLIRHARYSAAGGQPT